MTLPCGTLPYDTIRSQTKRTCGTIHYNRVPYRCLYGIVHYLGNDSGKGSGKVCEMEGRAGETQVRSGEELP